MVVLLDLDQLQGTFSLVKNSLHGAFNAASKVTGSIGKGLAALSMDDEYIARRAAFHQKKPRHLAEGLWQGGKSLFGGIAGGIAGIFVSPPPPVFVCGWC